MAVVAPVEEGKMLSEALNTVKIQVQQMKRNLVCSSTSTAPKAIVNSLPL
jgi:vacuolar protein sorting-associated protein 35